MIVKILDIKVDNISSVEAIAKIEATIAKGVRQTQMVTTLNPEIALKAHHDNDYKNILNSSYLTTADGIGIFWAAKKYRQKLKARVTGIDLINQLATISPDKKWRWFLLGGKQGVAKKAANKLMQTYPGINIIKAEDGGMITNENIDDQQLLASKIAKANADILIVSFGAPIQEKFIQKYKNQLGAKVAIGAGGSLDFIAGVKKRAPKIMRIMGLEWLWRFIREPKRFKRIWNAVVVFPIVIKRHIKQTK